MGIARKKFDDKITRGIICLLEKRLNNLENVTKSLKENICNEVDLCLDSEKIARQEGIDYTKYVNERRKLIDNYNKEKSGLYKNKK